MKGNVGMTILFINYLLGFLNESEQLIDYNMNKVPLWHGCYGLLPLLILTYLNR